MTVAIYVSSVNASGLKCICLLGARKGSWHTENLTPTVPKIFLGRSADQLNKNRDIKMGENHQNLASYDI